MTNTAGNRQLVFTEKDKCRVCYTCVRECPVKAIKIIDGQAEVIHERCIACGNCVKVCSQQAKYYQTATDQVFDLLKSDHKTVAIVAPSFPAEFTDYEQPDVLAGMIRKLGFDYVNEVAFGADMVAKKYNEIIKDNGTPRISSDCPAIVYYVRHYHPNLISNLAPVASPMVATARIMHKKHGKDIKIVFIGPCIAKKAESEEIDLAITFTELRSMFEAKKISPGGVEPCSFNPPHAGKGSIFPISRGLLQNLDIEEDISEGEVTVAAGKNNFREAIAEFENTHLNSTHMEVLCCDGCILGPGMSPNGKKYARRAVLSNYVKEKLENFSKKEWLSEVEKYRDIDFSQAFSPLDRRIELPYEDEINEVLKSMGKFSKSDMLNCGACGYDTCREHAIAIIQGLAENEMCLPYTIERLHNSIDKLNFSNQELANTKMALKQSEKLAHMGQLSAGIAHELNNPLGVITMYSNILKDETDKENPIVQDLELIVEQANRCRNIVGGLLNFARQNQVKLQEVNVTDFAKRSLESVIKPENVKIEFSSNIENPTASIDKDQMMQVLTNLEKNAIEAMPDGGTLKVNVSGDEEDVVFEISDTGTGISKENMGKLFTPFFTTKKTGKGTGLGLPLCYGIVKMHKGKIDVNSNNQAEKGPTGTSFIVRIPRDSSK